MFPSYSEITCHPHDPGSGSDTNSSLVANTTVVSTLAMTLCGSPTVLSIPPRSTVTTGTEIHLGHLQEPLREASLKHLTLKTVFLLATASAGRCSKLQALVFGQKYIRAGVTLYFSPEFMQRIRNLICPQTDSLRKTWLVLAAGYSSILLG